MSISSAVSRVAIGPVAVALVLSGCGSSGNTASKSSATPSQPVQTTTVSAPTETATSESAPGETATTEPGGPATSATSTVQTTQPETPTTSTTCPSTADLMAAWKAYPQTVPGVTGFTRTSCWSHWVVSFPQGPGDGAITFSTTPKLHVSTPAEAQQFNTEVCSATDSPQAWKQNESILIC